MDNIMDELFAALEENSRLERLITCFNPARNRELLDRLSQEKVTVQQQIELLERQLNIFASSETAT